MRIHNARPSAVHTFCAIVLGLVGCGSEGPAMNAHGQALVGGVPGATTLVADGTPGFDTADLMPPSPAPTLGESLPGIARLSPSSSDTLDLEADLRIAERGGVAPNGTATWATAS